MDDLIDGMIRMMNSRDGFTGPVNLGNPGEFTMLELAQKVCGLAGQKERIVFCKLPADDPVKRRPVIDLAKRELGWEPTTGLEDGLCKTMEYFRERLYTGKGRE